MDKRIAKALKVLVFNPVLLEAQHNKEGVETVLEKLSDMTLSDEEAQQVQEGLSHLGRVKSAIDMLNEAMDACDEEISS